ncbi:uncharacterized protein LOC122642042 isoform X2 [Telopea speciosissima]|uniref:uncharacterized protein LOC122642042 isoform X2 n=1 Tax=Telopea speciosissima TaxID=54955 RepID=UPI001CC38597|nr:uncharacterized protein LOC122642042 isoform X2 [Telopea speciosissima]
MGKMQHCSQWYLLLLAIFLLALTVQANENGVKTAVFLSPEFVLGPGKVENKFYYNIDYPRGHIAIKEFYGEVVDELGNSVALHETYLHHWVVERYYAPKGVEVPEGNDDGLHLSKNIIVRNSGVCQGNVLGQYFGVGSETRKTKTYVPDPYGIEVGNPMEIPNGFEERWLLNIHAIDTRGVVDRLGCTECRCDLYNITRDQFGRPLRPGYTGGLFCCYDQVQCSLKEGFESVKRSLYLRYTVKWVDWEDTIVPGKVYLLDVTDTGKRAHDSARLGALHGCQVEYEVESCGANGLANNGCVDTKKASIVMPHGGSVIYAVAHQHSGGVGSTLYGEDGRVICSSLPIYGEGKEPGNEAGYIVGMSSCYPQPGTVRIFEGETLILESNYNSTQKHTGVMGLFYILVADSPPKPMLSLRTSVHELKMLSKYSWALVFIGVAVAVIIGVGYLRRNEREGGYQSI